MLGDIVVYFAVGEEGLWILIGVLMVVRVRREATYKVNELMSRFELILEDGCIG